MTGAVSLTFEWLLAKLIINQFVLYNQQTYVNFYLSFHHLHCKDSYGVCACYFDISKRNSSEPVSSQM